MQPLRQIKYLFVSKMLICSAKIIHIVLKKILPSRELLRFMVSSEKDFACFIGSILMKLTSEFMPFILQFSKKKKIHLTSPFFLLCPLFLLADDLLLLNHRSCLCCKTKKQTKHFLAAITRYKVQTRHGQVVLCQLEQGEISIQGATCNVLADSGCNQTSFHQSRVQGEALMKVRYVHGNGHRYPLHHDSISQTNTEWRW